MRDKRPIWLFGSWSGKRYCDNSRYLFEHVSSVPNERAVWLSRNHKVVTKIRGEGREAYTFFSLKGILLCLRASYIVISYSFDDVNLLAYLFSPAARIIQLWHGTPLKKLEVKQGFPKNLFRRILVAYLGREFDYIITSSPETTKILQNHFHVSGKIFLETGYPRNDGLFKGVYDRTKGIPKRVLYLPTFRDYGGPEFNLFERYGFNLGELLSVLDLHDAELLIKVHYKDFERSSKILDSLAMSNRVRLINDEDIDDDLYMFLAHTDVLITDYSSVYFDFLLLNRPIIFSCFDRYEYMTKDRGFYLDYDRVTPGRKANNWSEISEEIGLLLSGKDAYLAERVLIRDMMNMHVDSSNSARVYNLITYGKS